MVPIKQISRSVYLMGLDVLLEELEYEYDIEEPGFWEQLLAALKGAVDLEPVSAEPKGYKRMLSEAINLAGEGFYHCEDVNEDDEDEGEWYLSDKADCLTQVKDCLAAAQRALEEDQPSATVEAQAQASLALAAAAEAAKVKIAQASLILQAAAQRVKGCRHG